MLPAIISSSAIVQQAAPRVDSLRWLQYFDPQSALEQVINHIETLPGSREERHTMRAYLSSLADYCNYLGATVLHLNEENYTFIWQTMDMPTRANTSDYIAHCKRNGLASSTITRYMAAVRHFLHALEEQEVNIESGGDYFFVNSAQRQMRLAADVKNPPPDRTSNRPALEQHGTRLSFIQINTLFASFEGEITTLAGKRDLALMYLGITSGLRAAELARLKLSNITLGKDCYEVKVRGKRSNHDPIGIDGEAFALINQFVDAWNDTLYPDDPRRITPDLPIFQPLMKGSHIADDHDASIGMSARAILMIVERRTAEALGTAITAHDMRRTCAFQMRANGFEWDQIRAQLRHRSIGTTEKYVGREQDLSRALLSKRVSFTVPHDLRLNLDGAA
jgi:site-specific recombinase XerD